MLRVVLLVILVSANVVAEVRSIPHWSDLPFTLTDTVPDPAWHFAFAIVNTQATLTMKDGLVIKGRLQGLFGGRFLIELPTPRWIPTTEVRELEITVPRKTSTKEYVRDALEPVKAIGAPEIGAAASVLLSPFLLAWTGVELAAMPIALPISDLRRHEKWRFSATFP